MEYERCSVCDEDLWYNPINDYLGVELEGVGIICKPCEREGVESGSYTLENITPPQQHLTFVLRALPHIKTTASRFVTSDWKKVIEVVGPESNRFDIAILDEDLSCFGDYVRQALLRGNTSAKAFIGDPAFIRAAYDSEAFHLKIFCGRSDDGIVLRWTNKAPNFDDYEDAIIDATRRTSLKDIFIGSCDEYNNGVVPDVSLKSLYYFPNQALKWMSSVSEAERAWKCLDMLKPEQYQLVMVVKNKRVKK
jgi:hypothetical protein